MPQRRSQWPAFMRPESQKRSKSRVWKPYEPPIASAISLRVQGYQYAHSICIRWRN